MNITAHFIFLPLIIGCMVRSKATFSLFFFLFSTSLASRKREEEEMVGGRESGEASKATCQERS